MKKLVTSSSILLIAIAVITQGVVIYISNTSAADSIRATKVSLKLNELSEENINIESKILTFASYQAVASRAAVLGFESTRDFVSVYDPVTVALSR
jgi:hypothetical protein